MRGVDDYLGLNYRMTVRRDEDGAYVAEAEELPGCAADGDTPAEAIDNLRGAMQAWMTSRLAAGLDIPEPRGEVDFSGRFIVRVPRFLHARLARQAALEGASLNQYVVSLLSSASENRAAGAPAIASPPPPRGNLLIICPYHVGVWASPREPIWRDWSGALRNVSEYAYLATMPASRTQWALLGCAEAADPPGPSPRAANRDEPALIA